MKLQMHSIERRWGDRLDVELAVNFGSASNGAYSGRAWFES